MNPPLSVSQGLYAKMDAFRHTVKKKWQEALPKILDVSKKVFLALLGIALFATNPTVFAIAFIAGIIWDKKVIEVSKKVEAIWKQMPVPSAIGAAVAAVLCLQVTWAAASVYYASNLGARLTQNALTKVLDETAQRRFEGESG